MRIKRNFFFTAGLSLFLLTGFVQLSRASGSGLGTAVIQPTTITEGSVANATVTFTVPVAGMTTGGRLQINLPQYWGPMQLQTVNSTQPGYVLIQTTAAVTFTSVTFSTQPAILLQISSGSFNVGQTLRVSFSNIYTACPPPGNPQAVWEIQSAMSSADSLSDLVVAPTPETYGTGTFQSLNFVPWSPITVNANQPSAALLLQSSDGCGQPVNAPSAIPITLAGLLPDQQNTDPGAQFSTTQNFATSTTTIQIPMSSTTTVFYYKTASAGTGLWMRGTYTNPVTLFQQQVWRQVTSLATGFTFGTPSVDNGTPVSGQTSMTLTPDGDGVNDVAFIRFNPTDPNVNWHVTISSDNFVDTVFDRWGFGNPQSSLTWDGHNMFNGSIVPNGTYGVKLEVVGLTADTSLSIVLNTAKISGSVLLGGSPVPMAWVNAQLVNGSGYGGTQTDASGNYSIYGLRFGGVYSLFTSFVSTTTQAQINGQISNVTAPASNQTFTIAVPGIVRISAVAPSTATATVFGSVNLSNSDFSVNVGGNVRLLAGTTTSDNGDPFNPSTWTALGVPPGSYTMHLNMQGYGATDQPVTVTANQTVNTLIPLTPRASVFGKITLSTAAASQIWVSLQGTLVGSHTPTVFGGASFNVGQSSAIYSIYAVTPGTYTFTCQIPNYIPLSLTNITVGTSDIGDPVNGGLDFSGFSTGGTISGQVTVNGDTSGQASPMNLWVSAYSPSLGLNASTPVLIATNSTVSQMNYVIGGLADGLYQVYPPYLPGFNASQQSVSVTNGVGHLDIAVNQNTGRIAGTITLPSGATDYNQVHLSLQGPVSVEKDLSSGPPYEIKFLDTGYYNLVATYLTSGAQVTLSVAVTNNQTQTVAIDLSAPTYAITGAVSVQSGFSMTNTTGAVVTVNTITDLLAATTNQTLTLGGSPGFGTNGGYQCNGGTSTVVSTARVEAFPKNFNSYNQSNPNTLPNCYGVGAYKYGTIAADGSYSIAGLTPGIWEVDVYPYFDNASNPDVAITKQVISVVSGPVNGTNFGLSKGNSVSGTITLPSGVTDVRTVNLQVQTSLGDTVQSASIAIGSQGSPAPSATYSVTSLAAGNYSLLIQDPGTFDQTLQRNVIKYVAQPAQFQITGGDLTGVNVTLNNASRVVGKLAIQGTNPDGSPALTLITPTNANLLPNSFQIFAQADPWVPSGSAQAAPGAPGTNSSIGLDSNNQFSIDGLIAGTYDISFQQNSYGISNQGQGSLNIAAYTQGGVVIPQGQTLDLGTITLIPGLSVSGQVTDLSGAPLANIRVRSRASNSQNGQNSIDTFTDGNGKFAVSGLSPNIKVYDFIAAPRPNPGEVVQPVPYGQISRLAVDVTKNPTLNFALPAANSTFTGKIVTGDGQPLSYPDGNEEGYPAAAVFSLLHGDNSVDNPLGDENATALDGSFSIADLPAGVYDLTVECLGYQPVKLSNITLTSNATKDFGTITLQRGAELDATLTKQDGSAVNTTDVNQAVAASADLSSIIFGQINSDAKTSNILSIKFAGFGLAPKSYSILLFDSRNNILVPPEGTGLQFTSNSDVVQRALTFRLTAPVALANVQSSGSSATLTYYFSRPLRNGPGDQDPNAWITIVSGNGSVSGVTLSGDRRQLRATYNPTTGEQAATLQFAAHTVDIDPSTGVEFAIGKTVRILLGQKATAEQSINPALGGGVSLADDLDPSNISIPPNAFLNADGSNTNATTSYALTFSATITAGDAGASTLVGAPRLTGMMQRGPLAYLPEAYAAMRNARDVATINPLSSYYSVLLPAGLSHTLNQTAALTLNYDTTADPAQINVYFFNGTEYLIENAQRTVDTVNHTITVNVSHFSTFVVLQNNLPVVQVNGGASAEAGIDVFNFPNPFNLNSKTKTLTHGGNTTTLTTEGTIIRYTIPAALNGQARIEIYDIIGEKVRTLQLGVPTPDTYNYIAWDGRNDSGNQVASGVYIGMLKTGSSKAFFKMAVIK